MQGSNTENLKVTPINSRKKSNDPFQWYPLVSVKLQQLTVTKTLTKLI